jgi:Fic family protein
MSPYLEGQKDRYIDLMFEVSRKGEWTPWIRFFMDAVVASASEAIKIVKRLQDLQKSYREKFQTAKRSALLLRMIDLAFERPALSVSSIAQDLGVTYQGALNNVNILIADGVASDYQRHGRNVYPRIIVFREIIAALAP